MTLKQNSKFGFFLKLFGGVIAAILFSAIGSGLWEHVLSPFLIWCYRVSVDVISVISTSYKDSIYKSASKGFHEAYSQRAFILLPLMFFMGMFYLTSARIRRSFEIIWSSIEEGKRKWLQRGLLILFMFFIFLVMSKHETINSTITYSIRSIDILRPYIGEEDYRKLLSGYYQIKTADDFYKFNNMIKAKAKRHDVILPEFDPI